MRRWFSRALDRWASRVGVRVRSVAAAVGVVTLALLLGGIGFAFALQSSLGRSGEAAASSRAAEIVSRIAVDGVPATAAALADQGRTDAVSLVLGVDGTVLGSSRRQTRTALSSQRPAIGDYQTVTLDLDTLDVGGEWQVVTTALTSDGATYYVQVAQSILVQRNVLQTVVLLMLAGTPLLLATVALAVWVLVGRALRSVERIRSRVATIDSRDLTARLEVPATRDELAALASTMNAMLDRLQDSDRAQRSFISDASHELRSPLSTISTAAELAVRTADAQRRTRLLETMNVELARMRELVANLMALARVDSPDSTARRVEVDLDDVVDREVQRLRATSRHELRVRVEVVRVLADPARVAQALRNLTDNADRHAVGRLGVTLTDQGGDAVIWVDNDGPPIDPEDRDRIFERFVRLDDSRSRDAGGSGLGLAIARASLVSQGGDVTVPEHPDGWCRFEMRVPLPTDVPRSVPAVEQVEVVGEVGPQRRP